MEDRDPQLAPEAPEAAAPAPPEPRQGVTAAQLVLGAVVAVLFAAATCVAAILAFDVHRAGPVVVAVATIGGGSTLARRVHDPPLKAAAIGLIVGGVAAVLLWPLFDVDSPTIGGLLS